MGAPVMAFCRIDDKEIRLREPVLEPDALIIQDPTLLHQVDLFTGLHGDGYILLNSTRSFDELGLAEFAGSLPRSRLCTRARDRDRDQARRAGRCPNVPLLGGFAAITGAGPARLGGRRDPREIPARDRRKERRRGRARHSRS